MSNLLKIIHCSCTYKPWPPLIVDLELIISIPRMIMVLPQIAWESHCSPRQLIFFFLNFFSPHRLFPSSARINDSFTMNLLERNYIPLPKIVHFNCPPGIFLTYILLIYIPEVWIWMIYRLFPWARNMHSFTKKKIYI